MRRPKLGIAPLWISFGQSFLFSLYLLARYGGEWRSSIFHEDNFLRAFPNLLSQVQPVATTIRRRKRCGPVIRPVAWSGLPGFWGWWKSNVAEMTAILKN